jgi:anthranilate phosphoribosyltransferase
MSTFRQDIIEQQPLSKAHAREVLLQIASGKWNNSQIASFITVYMMRTITVQELAGFRDAMLELCIPVQFAEPVMDVCGTGGDGRNTFNISTLSSFVVAACGQPVAKHGNYGVSSVSGSSNMLEYFGFKFTNDSDQLKKQMEKTNIAFMHAPLFHPAMKTVAPIRKELGVKTFFNMLGPMVNPAMPGIQLVGVFNLELARQYGYLYQQTDKHFSIIHCLGGYDELSLTNKAKVFTNKGEQVVSPEDFGFSYLNAIDITGGESVESAAKLFINILEGKGSKAQQEVVIANAAMALVTANRNLTYADASEQAKETLVSGRALALFKKLLTLQL